MNPQLNIWLCLCYIISVFLVWSKKGRQFQDHFFGTLSPLERGPLLCSECSLSWCSTNFSSKCWIVLDLKWWTFHASLLKWWLPFKNWVRWGSCCIDSIYLLPMMRILSISQKLCLIWIIFIITLMEFFEYIWSIVYLYLFKLKSEDRKCYCF